MAIQATDILAVMKDAGIKSNIIAGIKPELPLLKQGLDSIDLPVIAAATEAKYGVDLSDARASDLKTVNDFAAYINKLLLK